MSQKGVLSVQWGCFYSRCVWGWRVIRTLLDLFRNSCSWAVQPCKGYGGDISREEIQRDNQNTSVGVTAAVVFHMTCYGFFQHSLVCTFCPKPGDKQLHRFAFMMGLNKSVCVTTQHVCVCVFVFACMYVCIYVCVWWGGWGGGEYVSLCICVCAYAQVCWGVWWGEDKWNIITFEAA